jgi:hypothetical protein
VVARVAGATGLEPRGLPAWTVSHGARRHVFSLLDNGDSDGWQVITRYVGSQNGVERSMTGHWQEGCTKKWEKSQPSSASHAVPPDRASVQLGEPTS